MALPSLPKHEILNLIQPFIYCSELLSWTLCTVQYSHTVIFSKLRAFSSQVLKYLVSIPAFRKFPIPP